MPDFKPDYTPAEMLRYGVFGGAYFANATDADLEGLPDDVLALVPENRLPRRSKERNAYRAFAGMSYAVWKEKGWLFDEDPLGWFHWYCRYHAGRRHFRDAHQIRRWHNQGTSWHRFVEKSVKWPPTDGMRQSLFQWGYFPETLFRQYASERGLPSP